ncbi:MAG: hypothetical protein INR64_07355 [Caulobacteraceae bacterium]|nr:hypothetical protein [Caulobacter sp.]
MKHAGAAIALLALSLPGLAAASAWTLPKGDGQAILTGLGSDGPHGFDGAGDRVRIADYDKAEAYLLVEYGLTDAITVIVTPSLRHVSVDDASRDTNGFGYTDLGARWRIARGRDWVVSLQATLRAPGAERRDGLVQVDSTGEEYDLRVLAGRSFGVLGRPAFVDLQGGYRVRDGGPPDEWRADLTLGVRPWPRVLLLAQSFNVASNGAGTGIFGEDRYDNLALSGVYDLDRRWSVQVGGYATASGRNALDERGGIVALWWRFGRQAALRPPITAHR